MESISGQIAQLMLLIIDNLYGGFAMLDWVITFLVLAIIAAVFGFGGVAAVSAQMAQTIFVIFIILLIVSIVLGRSAL